VDAIGALGRIGAPQAAVPLRSGLAVGQPASVRIAAATALGRLDDVASVPSLAAALRAEHEPARAAAAALAQLGPSGWKALELAAPGSAEAREALAGVPAARSSP
jgi:HEAT repeat protein